MLQMATAEATAMVEAAEVAATRAATAEQRATATEAEMSASKVAGFDRT